MKEMLYIGPSPCNEPCAQVGEDNFAALNRKECRAYLNQIVRVYGEPPMSARLSINIESGHDAGTYREVVVTYDPDSEAGAEYAYAVEAGCAFWDEEAKKELANA